MEIHEGEKKGCSVSPIEPEITMQMTTGKKGKKEFCKGRMFLLVRGVSTETRASYAPNRTSDGRCTFERACVRDTCATYTERVTHVRVMLTMLAYVRSRSNFPRAPGAYRQQGKRFTGSACHNVATCLNAIADRAVNRHRPLNNFTSLGFIKLGRKLRTRAYHRPTACHRPLASPLAASRRRGAEIGRIAATRTFPSRQQTQETSFRREPSSPPWPGRWIA